MKEKTKAITHDEGDHAKSGVEMSGKEKTRTKGSLV